MVIRSTTNRVRIGAPDSGLGFVGKASPIFAKSVAEGLLALLDRQSLPSPPKRVCADPGRGGEIGDKAGRNRRRRESRSSPAERQAGMSALRVDRRGSADLHSAPLPRNSGAVPDRNSAQAFVHEQYLTGFAFTYRCKPLLTRRLQRNLCCQLRLFLLRLRTSEDILQSSPGSEREHCSCIADFCQSAACDGARHDGRRQRCSEKA